MRRLLLPRSLGHSGLAQAVASLGLSVPEVCLSVRSSHLEVGTGTGTAGISRNPRVSRGCGYECCANTAGMDLTTAGFPRGWILLRREPRLEPFT